MVKQDGTKTRARLAFVAQTFVQRADSPRLRPERRDAKHNQNCSDPTTRSILSLLSPRRSSSRRSCDDQYKSDRGCAAESNSVICPDSIRENEIALVFNRTSQRENPQMLHARKRPGG